MWEWECDNCGACCRAKKCIYYVDGRCEVYENRPDECRSAYAHKKYAPHMKKEDFIEMSKLFCNFLRRLECLKKS